MQSTKRKVAPQRRNKTNGRQKGDVTTPDATLRLIAAVGVTRASRLLGVSTTTLHKARKASAKVSRVIEVASAGALRDIGAGSEVAQDIGEALAGMAHATRAFLLEVPAAKAGIVERFGQALGAKIISA